MPPQIAFIKLTSYEAIPIKFFVKRIEDSTQGNSTSLAINSKSLITLNNHNNYQTKLSDSYLNKLINDLIGKQLRGHLLSSSIDSFGKDKVSVITYKDDKIQCKMVIDVSYMIALRVKLGMVYTADWAALGVNSSEELFSKFPLQRSSLGLMRWEAGIRILQEEDEEVEVDDKKAISYSIKKIEVLGDLERCVKVFLIS